jgi:hypothetical protein
MALALTRTDDIGFGQLGHAQFTTIASCLMNKQLGADLPEIFRAPEVGEKQNMLFKAGRLSGSGRTQSAECPCHFSGTWALG